MQNKPRPSDSRNGRQLASVDRRRIVVELTVDELDDRIMHAARAAIASAPAQPMYRDRRAEARRLGISVPTLDRLCRDGLPHVYVGDCRRFVGPDVDEWLRARSANREAAE